MRIEIRDRRGGFLWVANNVFDLFAKQLNSSAFMLYLALCRMANNNTQECYPSQELLAEMIGIDERTVRRAMEDLIQLNLVRKSKSGRHYSYSLLAIADNLSSIESGHSDPLKADNFPQNSGHGCTPNKTNNKTQEQEQTFPSPSAPEGFVLDPNPPSPKKKPSKADPRHRQFMELIFKAHKHFTKIEPIMGPVVGNKLKVLLKSAPKLDEKGFRAMLTNYHESENHNPADSPAFYVHKLPNYVAGPLNKWGRPSEAS